VYLAVECILADLMVQDQVRFHARTTRGSRVYH
jgi:hypothetical protein